MNKPPRPDTIPDLAERITRLERQTDRTVDSIRQGSETDLKLQSELASVIAEVMRQGKKSSERHERTAKILAAQSAYLQQIHTKVVPVVSMKPWYLRPDVWKVVGVVLAALAGSYFGHGAFK